MVASDLVLRTDWEARRRTGQVSRARNLFRFGETLAATATIAQANKGHPRLSWRRVRLPDKNGNCG